MPRAAGLYRRSMCDPTAHGTRNTGCCSRHLLTLSMSLRCYFNGAVVLAESGDIALPLLRDLPVTAEPAMYSGRVSGPGDFHAEQQSPSRYDV